MALVWGCSMLSLCHTAYAFFKGVYATSPPRVSNDARASVDHMPTHPSRAQIKSFIILTCEARLRRRRLTRFRLRGSVGVEGLPADNIQVAGGVGVHEAGRQVLVQLQQLCELAQGLPLLAQVPASRTTCHRSERLSHCMAA